MANFQNMLAMDQGEGQGFQYLLRSLGGGGALKRLRDAKIIGASAALQDVQEQELFNADIDRLRERLRDQRRGLLNPRGTFVQYWDMITMLALLYTMSAPCPRRLFDAPVPAPNLLPPRTPAYCLHSASCPPPPLAVVTPYEVGLDLTTRLDALFICNTLVSFVFLVDIGVQFVLPQPKQGSDKRGEANYERRHAVLARKYVTSWFLLDVLTIIPFDVMVWGGAVTGEVKMIKILRVLRLLKIVKVLRASSIIQRWENSFAIQSTKQTLGGFAFLTVVMLHWFACSWCLLAALTSSQREGNEAGVEEQLLGLMEAPDSSSPPAGRMCTGCLVSDPSTQPLCSNPCLTPCEREALALHRGVSPDYIFYSETWTCRAVETGHLRPDYQEAPRSVYLTALLVAMLQLVGGVSTILPTNVIEYVFFFTAILSGTVLFAAVQGVICGVVTNGDPDEIAWRQNLDALNFMMADTNLSHATRLNVRRFFRKSKRLFKRKSYDSLIAACLSTELQRDVRYQVASGVFQGVWWLRACERKFLEDLSVRVRRVAYGPQDTIAADETLNIITHGMATRGGVFLTVGASFGDVILSSRALRDTTQAKALSYCEVRAATRYTYATLHPIAPSRSHSGTLCMPQCCGWWRDVL